MWQQFCLREAGDLLSLWIGILVKTLFEFQIYMKAPGGQQWRCKSYFFHFTKSSDWFVSQFINPPVFNMMNFYVSINRVQSHIFKLLISSEQSKHFNLQHERTEQQFIRFKKKAVTNSFFCFWSTKWNMSTLKLNTLTLSSPALGCYTEKTL